jgi:hypothetical protein
MDRTTITNPELSETTGKQYLAWNNSYARCLQLLGLNAVPEPRRTLASYLAAKDAPTPAKAGNGAISRTQTREATQAARVAATAAVLALRGPPVFKHSEHQRAKWRERRRLRQLAAADML